MVRRVSRTGAENLPDIFANLALLGSLNGQEQQAEQAPLDLYGASQEPTNFNDVVETPQYTDVRQNENSYLENLRKIGSLPLAMSEDENLRQDAQENMRDFEPELPFGVQEQQLEGLSGLMGQQEAKNAMMPKPAVPQIAPEAPQDIYNIPQNESGKNVEPLEAIRMMVEKNPSLLETLPQETRNLLNPPQETQQNDPLQMIRSMVEKDSTMLELLPQEIKNKLQAVPENSLATQEPIPEQAPPEIPTVPVGTPITEQMIDQYPDQNVQAGAVEKGFTDDQIVNDLRDLAGGLIPQEQQERAKEWQNVYTKQRDDLTAEEKELLDKSTSGELTTFDKVALGIAVAVPILMALRYGTEAGLTSLGKGLEGFIKGKTDQEKQRIEKSQTSNKRLQEINKEKIALEEKNVDVKKKIMDSIKDGDARRFIRNKDLRMFGNDVGISTDDESGALWLNGKKFDASDEGVKRAREVVKGADQTIGIMKDSNKTLNEVNEILNQLPKGTGVWEAVKKNWQWFTSAGGHNPFGAEAPKIKMKGEDGKVREVDAFALLKQKVNILQDLYNKQILGGTRLTGNVVTHWGGILGDPTSLSDWFSQDLSGFKDTVRSLKDTMNSREIEKLVGEGFLREPLQKAFPSGNDKFVESEDNRLDRLRQTDPNELRKKVK